MEYFVPPARRRRSGSSTGPRSGARWYLELGVRESHLRLRPHDADELSHYSVADQRHRVPLPDRLVGARGDREPRRLRPAPRTPEYSGETLEYFDPQSGERYVPHVIEPAAGADRATLAFLVDAYDEEEVEGETRTLLRLHPRLAPVKVGGPAADAQATASPSSRARSTTSCAAMLQCEYDDGGSIGRRYRRQDEIGTPWCVTVDHQSLEDRTVTVRDRDTLAQERMAIDELAGELSRRLAAPWRTPEAGLSRRQSQRGGSGPGPRRRRESHQPLRRGAASPMAGSARSAVATGLVAAPRAAGSGGRRGRRLARAPGGASRPTGPSPPAALGGCRRQRRWRAPSPAGLAVLHRSPAGASVGSRSQPALAVVQRPRSASPAERAAATRTVLGGTASPQPALSALASRASVSTATAPSAPRVSRGPSAERPDRARGRSSASL